MKILLSVRARASLKAAARAIAELHRESGDQTFTAREFLALLLSEVTDGTQQAVIMSHLLPLGRLNRIISRCGFELCGRPSVAGLLFCEAHLHEAAIIDQRLAQSEGPVQRCSFDGVNADGTRGCSLYFRHPTSTLCQHHRQHDKPKPISNNGQGATITPLPLTRATKRSDRKKPKK